MCYTVFFFIPLAQFCTKKKPRNRMSPGALRLLCRWSSSLLRTEGSPGGWNQDEERWESLGLNFPNWCPLVAHSAVALCVRSGAAPSCRFHLVCAFHLHCLNSRTHFYPVLFTFIIFFSGSGGGERISRHRLPPTPASMHTPPPHPPPRRNHAANFALETRRVM